MNFEFAINIFKSVDPAKAPQIEMVAVEVKAAPCENCVVTMKAGAVAMFVVDGSDWSKIKTDVKYDTNSEAFIKFKLKNAESWVGKGLKLVEFAYFKGNKGYPLWKDGANLESGRYPIEVVTMWDVDTGEVRIKVPSIQVGHKQKICFEGQFKLVDVDDNGEFGDPIPYEDAKCEDGGPCESERFAFRQRRL